MAKEMFSLYNFDDRMWISDKYHELFIITKILLRFGYKKYMGDRKGLKFYAWYCQDCGNVRISPVIEYNKELRCNKCYKVIKYG